MAEEGARGAGHWISRQPTCWTSCTAFFYWSPFKSVCIWVLHQRGRAAHPCAVMLPPKYRGRQNGESCSWLWLVQGCVLWTWTYVKPHPNGELLDFMGYHFYSLIGMCLRHLTYMLPVVHQIQTWWCPKCREPLRSFVGSRSLLIRFCQETWHSPKTDGEGIFRYSFYIEEKHILG